MTAAMDALILQGRALKNMLRNIPVGGSEVLLGGDLETVEKMVESLNEEHPPAAEYACSEHERGVLIWRVK